MRTRQLSFLPKVRTEYGGVLRKGKRKIQRPFDPKRPLHITLRSSRARGGWSLLCPAHKWRISDTARKIAEKRSVRIYRFANVGNHVHLLIQAGNRRDYQAFLREFAGKVAAFVTGATKGRPEKFWDGLAWSKIVDWGRQFTNCARYILLNVLESVKLRDRVILSKLERDGVVLLE